MYQDMYRDKQKLFEGSLQNDNGRRQVGRRLLSITKYLGFALVAALLLKYGLIGL
jgi:hypothetical protein